MASSSKDCGTTKKVIVIKSNDFYALKTINSPCQKEKSEDLKINVTQGNVSVISKICPVFTQSNPNSRRSLLKVQNKRGKINKQKSESTPVRKYTRKVSTVEKVAEKVAAITVQKTSENEIITIDDDLTEEKVMELVNIKYGDALEAQLPFLQENNVSDNVTMPLCVATPKKDKEIKFEQDSTPKLPSDIYDYKLREEQFIEQIEKENCSNDDIKEAQKHLESILILDSPEDGYKLFTREELKNLPVKIFESPPNPIKREFSSVKVENLKEEDVAQFKNLVIKTEEDGSLESVPKNEFKAEKNIFGTQETSDEKKFWELELKDINFDTMMSEKNSANILDCDARKGDIKDVGIADEDAVIFKEMDEFIQEIKVENQVLTCSKPDESTKHEKLDLANAETKNNIEINRNIKKFVNLNKFGSSPENRAKIQVDDAPKCVIEDTAAVEIPKESDKTSNKNSPTFPNISVDSAVIRDKTEENLTIPQTEGKKSDDLDTLLLECKIHKYSGIETTKNVQVESQVPNVGALNILERPAHTNVEEQEQKDIEAPPSFILLENVTYPNEMDRNNSKISPEEIRERNTTNDSQIQEYNTPESLRTALRNTTWEQHSSSECEILIIKENGALEPINFTNDEPTIIFNKNQAKNSHFNEVSSSLRESSSFDPNYGNLINKEEILSLLEKAKTSKYNFESDDKNTKENLVRFGNSLNNHIGILKKLYTNLEIAVKAINADVTNDENTLRDNLNFIKSIVDKSFVTAQKQLKFKVVSITKKGTEQTNPTQRTTPRRTTFVYRTMCRVNKFLDQFANTGLPRTCRRNAVGSKLTRNKRAKNVQKKSKPVKKMVGMKSSGARILNCGNSESSIVDEQDLTGTESGSNSKRNSAKSVSGVLERSSISKVGEESFTSLCSCNTDEENTNEDVTEIKQLSPNTVSPDVKSEVESVGKTSENYRPIQCKQEKQDVVINNESTSRYFLRPRKLSGSFLELEYFGKCCKDEPFDKTVNRLSYEVDYSNVIALEKKGDKFDYVFRNDDKPSVVLYHKNEPELRSRTLPENSAKERIPATNRYETRSKVVQRHGVTDRVLRSRRL